jgi:hypothetical protein
LKAQIYVLQDQNSKLVDEETRRQLEYSAKLDDVNEFWQIKLVEQRNDLNLKYDVVIFLKRICWR